MARASVRIAAPARAVVASAVLALPLLFMGGCPGPQGPDPGHLSPPPAPDLEVDRIPMETTPSDRLSTDQLRHTELVRDEQVVARAATTWAFMSLATGRPQRIPDPLREAFP